MSGRRAAFRTVLFGLCATLWFGVILIRLWDLQIRQADRLTEKALRQQEGLIEVQAARGAIYDRLGNQLALSTPVDSIGVIPSKVGDPQLTASLLAEILQLRTKDVLQKLRQKRFQWIKRLAEPGQAARVRSLGLPGIHFEKESKRYYPKGRVASHLLGAVGVDHQGLAGLEQSFEAELRGTPGRRLVQHDALQNRYASRNIKEPTPGTGLALTIDQRIQMMAEKELARAIAETGSKAGSIVIADPHNGDLLAVANWPTFDPNERVASLADLERRRNFAVSHLFEPGSSFKLVTIAAALEERITDPGEVLDCEMGGIRIGSRFIRDHKPFGALTVTQVLAHSSNVGTIKLALRLEPERLYRHIRRFGFGTNTGLPLPGEIDGLVRRPEDWHPAAIGSVAIGQEIGVTAVQLARATSVVANGGLLVQPRIVAATIRPGGRREPLPSPPSVRVLRPETAAALRAMMEVTVREGTGRLAGTAGYRIGGKTGTAQKIDPETGAYSATDYVPSFVGFAPVNDPAIVVVIVLDSPVGKYYGGQVAAPVFPRVATAALRYRDVPPELPVAPGESPRRIPRQQVPDTLLADFVGEHTPRLAEAGPSAYQREADGAFLVPAGGPHPGVRSALSQEDLSPGPAQPLRPAVRLRLADSVAPDFRGQTLRQVVARTTAMGLQLQVRGSGTALRQWPPAGAPLRRGQSLTVEFSKSLAGLTRGR